MLWSRSDCTRPQTGMGWGGDHGSGRHLQLRGRGYYPGDLFFFVIFECGTKVIPVGREKRGRARAGGRWSDRVGERRGIFVGSGH